MFRFVVEVFDFVERKSQALQVPNRSKFLHLGKAVVTVSRPRVGPFGDEQTLLLIVAQGLYRHLHELRELSDFEFCLITHWSYDVCAFWIRMQN